MARSLRWTSADLDLLPDDGKRYEIIDGELYVSKQPSWEHQVLCGRLFGALDRWDQQAHKGAVNIAPGLIFAEDEDVVPDLVWVARERLPTLLGPDRKLHAAPDLAVEVLSPGAANERRDREAKLKLYSRHGVKEYWIVDWQRGQIEVFRRAGIALELSGTLIGKDTLESPLLPGFQLALQELFAGLPSLQ